MSVNSEEKVVPLRSLPIYDAMWEAIFRVDPSLKVFKAHGFSIPTALKLLGYTRWVQGRAPLDLESEEFLRKCARFLEGPGCRLPDTWEELDQASFRG